MRWPARSVQIGHLRHAVASALPASWTGTDGGPPGVRIAAAVFLVGGLLAVAVNVVVPAGGDTSGVVAGAVAAIAGAAGVAAPWERWTPRAALAVPAFALVLLAFGGIGTAGTTTPFIAILPLPFVFVGITYRPGRSLALAPFAAAALVVANRFTVDRTLVATLLFALPMSVVVGEAIAQVQVRRNRAELRIERLLHAVRALAHVTDERAGAHLVASLATELLDADAVAVMLTDRPRSTRYLNRAWFGHPTLADAAPLVVDSRRDGLDLRPGVTQFIPDVAATPVLPSPGPAGRVRSAAIVTLPGEGARPLGIVVALWGSARRTLPAPARQAGELLSQEAGRMFCRLQATAALARDAHTDPLTELANRRTFGRALATLQPGDAVVIVDLDHFKMVNDRFGHEAGDDTLRLLARCLRDVSRQVDCISRYGGEEFALILPEAGADGARALLHRLRRAWASHDVLTSFSSGIAVHADGDRAEETLRRADIALYEAKEAGRNRDVVAADEVVLP